MRAHVGAEVSVSDLPPRMRPPEWLPHQHLLEPSRVPLLCASRTGYANLSQLITRYKMREGGKGEGVARMEGLAELADGLVCLTGSDEGPLAAALMAGGEAAGWNAVERMVRTFRPSNVYVELQRQRRSRGGVEKQRGPVDRPVPAPSCAGYQRRSLCDAV